MFFVCVDGFVGQVCDTVVYKRQEEEAEEDAKDDGIVGKSVGHVLFSRATRWLMLCRSWARRSNSRLACSRELCTFLMVCRRLKRASSTVLGCARER